MAERVHGDVDVTIDEDGNASVEAKGVKGSSCVDLTKALEKALGKTTSRRQKGEYHQKPRQHLKHGTSE
jgi:hypothetical protein